MSLRYSVSLRLWPLFLAAPLMAQPVSLELGAGLARPTGEYDTDRGPGPSLSIALIHGEPVKHFRFRAEFEQLTLRRSTTTPEPDGGSLRIRSGFAAFLFEKSTRTIRPYLALGAGGHWLRVGPHASGFVPGGRAAFGFEHARGRLRWGSEVGGTVILSNFGHGVKLGVGTFHHLRFFVRLPGLRRTESARTRRRDRTFGPDDVEQVRILRLHR